LHSLLSEVLESDPDFVKLFKAPENENHKITAMQQQAEQELVKLLEIVLLDKYGPFENASMKKA